MRPVLILSHDVVNARPGTAIAFARTSQPQQAGFPLRLESAGVNLPKRSSVKSSQIRTIAAERIGRRIARASHEELAQVPEGLKEIRGA
ncbi:MAG: type II toxin-antitoxin system PemK/MazF family toxin [Gemmatimonadaceae bacterium]|nr:type II toxin-antitoxin system PemK/MazF family toxin [Gemmatimonadaceae bacterium]